MGSKASLCQGQEFRDARRGSEKGSGRHGKLPRQETEVHSTCSREPGARPRRPHRLPSNLEFFTHRLPSNLEFRLGAGPSGSSGGRVSWGGLHTAALPALDSASPTPPWRIGLSVGSFLSGQGSRQGSLDGDLGHSRRDPSSHFEVQLWRPLLKPLPTCFRPLGRVPGCRSCCPVALLPRVVRVRSHTCGTRAPSSVVMCQGRARASLMSLSTATFPAPGAGCRRAP